MKTRSRWTHLLQSAVFMMLWALPAMAQRVVVFPLQQTEGPPAAEWLGTGLAVAVNDALADAGATTLPVKDLESYYAQEGLVARPRFTAASEVALARQLGAGALVRGTFSVREGQVTAEVEALSLTDALSRLGKWQEFAALADVAGLSARLGAALLPALSLKPAPPRAMKPEAFEAFIRGRAATDPTLREVYFRKALELEPAWDDARCYLAMALAEEDRTTEAKELLVTLRGREYPRAAQGLVALGLIVLQEGDVGEARKLFLESLRRRESPDAHIALARLALRLKRPDEAARELRVAESFGTHQDEIDDAREELLRLREAAAPAPAPAPTGTPGGGA